MKIVLVGYMGSGKSTIGRLLSKKLNINFIDLDVRNCFNSHFQKFKTKEVI